MIWLQLINVRLVPNSILSTRAADPFFVSFSLLKPSFCTDSWMYLQTIPLFPCWWEAEDLWLLLSGLCGWYIQNDQLAGMSSITDNCWVYTAIFSSLRRLTSVFFSYSSVSSRGNLELGIFETRSFCQIWSKLANSFKSYEGGDENWQAGSTSVWFVSLCSWHGKKSFLVFQVGNQNSETCI